MAALLERAHQRITRGPAAPPDVVADVDLMVELLRLIGYRVEYVPGWQTRGSGAFRRIRTALDHHDAFPASSGHAGGLRTCTFGRPDLRNSLCMFYLASDGTIYVVAARVSWHAGKGRLTTNPESRGIEARNSGLGEPWPAVQLDPYADLDALAVLFWAVAVYDHKEHSSTGKIDRTGIDPGQWRARVAKRVAELRSLIAAGHLGEPVTPPPPPAYEEPPEMMIYREPKTSTSNRGFVFAVDHAAGTRRHVLREELDAIVANGGVRHQDPKAGPGWQPPTAGGWLYDLTLVEPE